MRLSISRLPTQRKSSKPVTPPPEGEPWLPPLFGKQWDIWNSRKKILLACGSRRSGKTLACLHRLVRHMWETPGASVGIFAKTIKLAKDEGIWTDLINYIIPIWEKNLEGFGFTTMDGNKVPGPKQDNQTRTVYFGLKNYWGGTSTCRLFSIEHDHEVASKVQGKRFSMVYFSELAMFKSKVILAATYEQLRMIHLLPKPGEPDVSHQWMADTNPDVDLGTNSWIYKLWYVERIDPNYKDKNYQGKLELIEMFAEENPYNRQEDRDELANNCAGEVGLYQAWVEGKWPPGTGSGKHHFTGVFSRDIHVIGAGPNENGRIAIPSNTSLLLSGWDLGRTNQACGIVHEWHRKDERGVERVCFSVLDELVLLKERTTLSIVAQEFIEKKREVEKQCAKTPGWIHWTDDSSINVWNPTSGTFDYQEILSATRGEIRMQGVPHTDGSVKARVRLVRRLLRENRLFVAARCERLIAMFENLQQGSSEKEFVQWNEHKHSFDWLSYVLFMQCQAELQEDMKARPEADKAGGDDIISVG